jgi:hypothetical protein
MSGHAVVSLGFVRDVLDERRGVIGRGTGKIKDLAGFSVFW